MVHAVYDHIVAIVIVGALFVGTVVAVPAMSFLNFQAVDQQQLRNTTYNVLDSMLLGTGSPLNWGSMDDFTEYDVKAFGLASSKESSLYVLDIDKVQRLDSENPFGYIEYEYARNLLKLQEYGFIFTLFRPFVVNTNLQIGRDSVWFAVNVTRTEDTAPIPNAQVECTIMAAATHISHLEEPILVQTLPYTYFTDLLGHCEATIPTGISTDYSLSSALAILKITVGGMSTLAVARAQEEPLQEFVKIYTSGDNIALKIRNESISSVGEVRCYHIDSYNANGQIINIFDGRGGNPTGVKVTPGEGYVVWGKTFAGLEATNPLLLLFTLRVKNPDRLVIIAGPLGLMNPSGILTFGPYPDTSKNVVINVRRFVVISGLTYVADLVLWEEPT